MVRRAVLGERLQDLPGGVHRVGWQAQGAGEDIGAATGQARARAVAGRLARPAGPPAAMAGRSRYRRWLASGAEDAVDGFVNRAVAAQREHQAIAVRPGSGRQFGGMPPVACLHDLKFDSGRKGRRDDIPAKPGRGGGMWVHDQERAHALRLTARPRLSISRVR